MLSIRTKPAAFTLVEISIAVGIFAVAIVAILALFPVGLRSAYESRTESVVTQIARAVLSDLRTGTFNKARIAINTTPNFLEYDLALVAPTPVYLTYNSEGKVIAQITAESYALPIPPADYIVTLESKLVATAVPPLTQVTVTVQSPASAPASARRKYPVVTFMGDIR